MSSLPIGVIGPMAASGGCAPSSLLEVRTYNGGDYFWSDGDCTWPSVLTGAPQKFNGWLAAASRFQMYGTTQTDTANFTVQNLSGNTVTRDVALALSSYEFIHAFIYFRLWRGDAEQSIFTFMGNVVDAQLDDNQLDLSVEGFGNYSRIPALPYKVDVSCGLNFGGIECASVASSPCQQTYGSCSSKERFKGFVTQWSNDYAFPNRPQTAQPAPLVEFNRRRAF